MQRYVWQRISDGKYLARAYRSHGEGCISWSANIQDARVYQHTGGMVNALPANDRASWSEQYKVVPVYLALTHHG